MRRTLIPVMFLVVGVGVGAMLMGTRSSGQPQPIVPVPRELSSYRDVVKRVLPAVVSIETRAKGRVGAPLPQIVNDPRMPAPDPNRLGFGSGFMVDPSGVVVTNYHVVEGAEVAIVNLLDGRKFTSKDIRVDKRTDVAVIVLDVKDAKFDTLAFGDSDAMEIGDRVLAVGAPFGLAGSVTHGIVSAKGRAGLHMNMYEDFLQTDAAINPGNSGGPLVNLEGKVVGINAAIKSKNGGFQGVGLAVASNLAKSIVTGLQTDGTIKRGYLGIQVRELDAEVAARLGVPKDSSGVVVAEVYANTPAAKGGLLAGDVLTKIADKAIKDGNVLQRVVATLPLGKPVSADIIREGKAQQVNITIEEQPSEYGVSGGVPAPRPARGGPTVSVPLDTIGIEAVELTDDFADDLGFRKGLRGIVVTRVQQGTPASISDLRRGMVITKIDDQVVASPNAAQQVLQKADLTKGTLLQIATPQGGVNYVMVKSAK